MKIRRKFRKSFLRLKINLSSGNFSRNYFSRREFNLKIDPRFMYAKDSSSVARFWRKKKFPSCSFSSRKYSGNHRRFSFSCLLSLSTCSHSWERRIWLLNKVSLLVNLKVPEDYLNNLCDVVKKRKHLTPSTRVDIRFLLDFHETLFTVDEIVYAPFDFSVSLFKY